MLGLTGFLWLVADYLTRAYPGPEESRQSSPAGDISAPALPLWRGRRRRFCPEHVWFYPRVLFLWCVLAGMCFPAAFARRD